MTTHSHLPSGEQSSPPTREEDAPSRRELRQKWVDSWLTGQLINARLGTDPVTISAGKSLYHSLTYSAACVFPDQGDPRNTAVAMPPELSFADPKEEVAIKELLQQSREAFGLFSLHVLDLSRREVSQWAQGRDDAAHEANRLFIERTGRIVEALKRVSLSEWPTKILNKDGKIESIAWNRLDESVGFFFRAITTTQPTIRSTQYIFENLIPYYTSQCENVLALLENRDAFSMLALQDLQEILATCIEELNKLRKTAPSDELTRRTRSDVLSLLAGAVAVARKSGIQSLQNLNQRSIKSAFEGMIQALTGFQEELSRIIKMPSRLHQSKRRLTPRECDQHVRQLAAVPSIKRPTGAMLAELLLDAIDEVNSHEAGIRGLAEWLETISALYISPRRKGRDKKPLVENLNASIEVALQRYANIFNQANQYCTRKAITSSAGRHFVARIWLMAAGHQAVSANTRSHQVHNADDTLIIQRRVLALYMQAIVARINSSQSKIKPRRNFVEVGLFEWHPRDAAFRTANDILSAFRMPDHFDWDLTTPPALPRQHSTPPSTVHNLTSEYWIQNRLSVSDTYPLNRRLSQLGLPLVGKGVL